MAANPPAIRELPEHLINQIAAGEVIERPMSVVKELVENSLDAGATRIDIEITSGGIESIVVSDNGCGMSAESLAAAFRRHWTSKISRPGDLAHISSLGFRGEALASIAAVADVAVVSRAATAAHAWRYVPTSAQTAQAPIPASGNCGTRIEVRQLFNHVPARKRFLKQPRTEQLHVQRLVRQLIFAAPRTAFSLRIDAGARTDYPAATGYSSEPRWRQLFGQRFVAAARAVTAEIDGITIQGWLGDPEQAATSSEQQYLAINGRMVRDRQLSHAIRVAFGERIASGRFPAYALALNLPLDRIDVNVHPGKLEVRLLDLRTVHDVLASAVKHALGDLSATTAPVVPPQMPRAVDENRAAYAASPRPATTKPQPQLQDVPPVLALIEQRYLLLKSVGEIVVLDLEQLWREILLRRLASADASEQRALLIPARVPLSSSLSETTLEALGKLGFHFETLGQAGQVMRAVPRVLPQLDWDQFLRELAPAQDTTALDRVASAAAGALSLPSTGVPDKSWLEQFWLSLAAADIDYAGHGVRLNAAALRTLFQSTVAGAALSRG